MKRKTKRKLRRRRRYGVSASTKVHGVNVSARFENETTSTSSSGGGRILGAAIASFLGGMFGGILADVAFDRFAARINVDDHTPPRPDPFRHERESPAEVPPKREVIDATVVSSRNIDPPRLKP